MKHYRLKLTIIILAIVGFVAMLGVAGDIDYCDQVILHMTYDEYAWVKDTLTKQNGQEPSEREIAHWWADHHAEY